MDRVKTALRLAWILVTLGFIVFAIGLFVRQDAVEIGLLETLGMRGEFIAGTAGSLWSLASVIFIYATFATQQRQIDSLERKETNDTFNDYMRLLIERIERSMNNMRYGDEQGVLAFSQIYQDIVGIVLEQEHFKTMEAKSIAIEHCLNETNLRRSDTATELIVQAASRIEGHSDKEQASEYYHIIRSLFNKEQAFYFSNWIRLDPVFRERTETVQWFFRLKPWEELLVRENGGWIPNKRFFTQFGKLER